MVAANKKKTKKQMQCWRRRRSTTMGSFSSLSDLHLRPSLRLPPSPTPTPPSLLPFLPSCSIQSMPPRRRTAFPAASWALEDHIRSSLFQRRSLLLVGLSSLARSPLKAGASEVSVPGLLLSLFFSTPRACLFLSRKCMLIRVARVECHKNLWWDWMFRFSTSVLIRFFLTMFGWMRIMEFSSL